LANALKSFNSLRLPASPPARPTLAQFPLVAGLGLPPRWGQPSSLERLGDSLPVDRLPPPQPHATKDTLTEALEAATPLFFRRA
jgi:hypothetical protein